MKKFILVTCLSGFCFSTALAQDTTNTDPVFWEASLVGGEYLVDITKIQSVSLHSYNVKNIGVVEVVIDTGGDALARFYSFSATEGADDVIESLEAEAREQLNAIDPVGVQTKVVKEYPITTHAKTVEYNLGSSSEVEKLYNSIKRSWKSTRAGKFSSGK